MSLISLTRDWRDVRLPGSEGFLRRVHDGFFGPPLRFVYRRGSQEHERKLKSIETLAVDLDRDYIR